MVRVVMKLLTWLLLQKALSDCVFALGAGTVDPFSPGQFISMYALLTLFLQTKLFDIENKANMSYTVHSNACLQGNYRDSLGGSSITSYGVFRSERVS